MEQQQEYRPRNRNVKGPGEVFPERIQPLKARNLEDMRPQGHLPPSHWIDRTNTEFKQGPAYKSDQPWWVAPRTMILHPTQMTEGQSEPDPIDRQEIPHKPFEISYGRHRVDEKRDLWKEAVKAAYAQTAPTIVEEPCNITSKLAGCPQFDKDDEQAAKQLQHYFYQCAEKDVANSPKLHRRAKEFELVSEICEQFMRFPRRHGMETCFDNVMNHYWLKLRFRSVNFVHRQTQKKKLDRHDETKETLEKKRMEKMRRREHDFMRAISFLTSYPFQENEHVYDYLKNEFSDILEYAKRKTNFLKATWEAQGEIWEQTAGPSEPRKAANELLDQLNAKRDGKDRQLSPVRKQPSSCSVM